jgi:hypothetical protein
MSDINQLTNKKCSFTPEDFKPNVKTITQLNIENRPVAPDRSFPWAMIQLFRNQPVRRLSWDAGVFVTPRYDNQNNIIEFLKTYKDYSTSPWEADATEVVACDWVTYSFMLSFNLTSESGIYYPTDQQTWGYVTDNIGGTGANIPFGTLSGLQSDIGIENVLMFCYREKNPNDDINKIWLNITYDQSNKEKIMILLNNAKLSIIADNIDYNLGFADFAEKSDNSATVFFKDNDVEKLSLILKQTDKPITFDFNWE